MEIIAHENKKIQTRLPVVYLIVLVIFAILLVNLVKLQIVKGNENLFLSSTIKTSEVVVRAPRGLIYDRNGNALAVNKPSFKLIANIAEIPVEQEQQLIARLGQMLQIDGDLLWEDYEKKVYDQNGNRLRSQTTLISDVSRDNVVSLSSRIDEFPGIYVEVGTSRQYVDGKYFAHTVGYVTEVTDHNLREEGFFAGDTVGATGIEQFYDSILRGENGRRILETNRDEETVRELIPIEARPGSSIELTIDAEMQKELTKALQQGIEIHQAGGGAAVILDIHSGEILSLVSLPTFDPNMIVGGLTYSEYQSLSEDATLPLYNRAISLTQPPGSTFKTIVASAALQEGVIQPETVFHSAGCMDLGGGFEFCEAGKRALGDVDLLHGISRSSNIYFCNTMLRLGIDNLNKYTGYFGLGEKTGIDLMGEQTGSVASKELKQTLEGTVWYQGDSCNTGIGQGLMRVSPLQMVSWVSTIANDGTYYKPHLLRNTLDGDGNIVESFEKEAMHTIQVDHEHLSVVRDGMHLAVNDPGGSAFPLRGLAADPAVKTGSAEAFRKNGDIFERTAHSWVTGFFPYEDPEYAFVVYLEYGGWGYKSAEVMRTYLEWYDTRYNNQ